MTRFPLRRRSQDRWRQARADAQRPAPPTRAARPLAPPDGHPVPKTFRDAAEWSWRFLLITAAILVILKGLTMVSTIVIPVLVAILLAALLEPLFAVFARGVSRTLAAGLTAVFLLLILTGIFVVVGRTLSSGLGDMTDQVLQGIEEIRAWVRD